MESAKVYFSDLRTDEISTLEKLRRLMKAAGFEQIDFKDKYVAVKLHFGEPGNMAYLRPNWARVVCDYVRALGGKPFLTDCNTLYVGGRANALDHLDSAMLNGYSPMTTGAQCIIADGLKGEDYDLVPIRGGKYLRAAKVALNEYAFPEKKVANIQSQLTKLVSRNYYLNKSARDAYRSYIMAYASHSLKDIFNVNKLDLKAVARGFGFEVPPMINMAFVKNSGKNTRENTKRGKGFADKRQKKDDRQFSR